MKEETLRILERILAERPDLSEEEVYSLVKRRIDELGGLIEEDAAAMLVAKELGVRLPKSDVVSQLSSLKIGDIVTGLRNIALRGYVLRVSNLNSIEREGRVKKYLRIVVGDETGAVSLSLWNEEAERAFRDIRPGDIVLIEGAFSRKYRGRVELGLPPGGRLERIGSSDDLLAVIELARRNGIKVYPLKIVRVSRRPDLVCIHGIDHNLNRVRLVVYQPSFDADMLEPGLEILIQDYRRFFEEDGRIKIFSGRYSRIFKVKVGIDREAEQPPILSPSELKSGEPGGDELAVRGYLIAILPFRVPGGSLFLGDAEEIVRIAAFKDSILACIPGDYVGREVKVLSVELYGQRGEPLYKITECSEVVASDAHLEELASRRSPEPFLAAGSGLVKTSAAVLSANVRTKYLTDRVLVGFSARIDDGSAQAIALSSHPSLLEKILGLKGEEIMEYHREGVLGKILDYLTSELIGETFEFRGLLYRDGYFALLDVSP